MTSGRDHVARIVVAGASGFVGRHVIAAFRAAAVDCAIFGVTRSAPRLPLDGHLELTLGSGNVGRLESYLRNVRPAVVVNCTGALSGDPAAAARASVASTIELVAGCSACTHPPFLIQIGSSAEYTPKPFGERTAERDTAEPTTEYGCGKLRGTKAVLEAHERHEIRAVVLRFFNVVGARMRSATLPGRLATFIRDSDEIELEVGSLEPFRDFVDIRDAARAVVCAAERVSEAAGEIVNVGSGQARQTRALAEGMVARSQRPVRLIEGTHGSARSAGVAWQEAAIDKARRILGWAPLVPWEETLDYLVGEDQAGVWSSTANPEAPR